MGRGLEHPGNNTQFHLQVLRSESTVLISPGLRKPLTKTRGDIRGKFPELSQHGRGAVSLMLQVNS